MEENEVDLQREAIIQNQIQSNASVARLLLKNLVPNFKKLFHS